MNPADTGNDTQNTVIARINERKNKLGKDDGKRIVLARVFYADQAVAGRVPFSGDHGHPNLPCEAMEAMWLKLPYWEGIGHPDTITVTIKAGGDPVPAPITDAEQATLDEYDAQMEATLAQHEEQVAQEKAMLDD